MKQIIKWDDIDKLSQEEQLAFYKSEFESLHCRLDGCGNEVNHNWVMYDSLLYCEDCFEWKRNEEVEKAIAQITKMNERIQQLKAEYDIP
ncbi:hypothetical protein PP175_25735 (plasmid) [Aneurinibacillus sp. Ricciae_BoGa-3]|uniref:hypothetical protein n=1 Tax=Aneurinibacillus sp. Ricciae_BoGa-3 TaxID=3022697 RepID=UPI002340AFB8|nr:hypothetical protein [Aneurinibacillus sp. Ricciae_BoGa-3]WCK57470.1 hypothetical protein PP175_25735 [Aneurinibacillus sp. Ricciae_BoGa-3]